MMPVFRISCEAMSAIVGTWFAILSICITLLGLGHRTRIISITFRLKLFVFSYKAVAGHTGRDTSGFPGFNAAQHVGSVTSASRPIIGCPRSFLPEVVKLNELCKLKIQYLNIRFVIVFFWRS